MKNKIHQSNYRTNVRNLQLKIDEAFAEREIPANDSVRLLDPNYHEIARFRSTRLTVCGEALFYQLVKQLAAIGEIQYEHLFVDGTKIEAGTR